MEKPETRISSSATVDLGGEHLALLDEAKIKVGSRVRIVLTGTVREVSSVAREDPFDEGVGAGKLGIDVADVRLAASNDIAELFEDDLGG